MFKLYLIKAYSTGASTLKSSKDISKRPPMRQCLILAVPSFCLVCQLPTSQMPRQTAHYLELASRIRAASCFRRTGPSKWLSIRE